MSLLLVSSLLLQWFLRRWRWSVGCTSAKPSDSKEQKGDPREECDSPPKKVPRRRNFYQTADVSDVLADTFGARRWELCAWKAHPRRATRVLKNRLKGAR